jgi:hypothetical protein
MSGVGEQRDRMTQDAVSRLHGDESEIERDANRKSFSNAGRGMHVAAAVMMARA